MGNFNCKNCTLEKEDKSLEIIGGVKKQEEIKNTENDFPHDSDIRQYQNNLIYNGEIQSQKEKELVEEGKVENEEKEDKIWNEKKDQDQAGKREEDFEEIEENDIMNEFGKTVIQTIYNKENNNNYQPVNDINYNLNNNEQGEKYVTTASKEGAIDLSNIQFLNSAEPSQILKSNNQQEYFTNLPPGNINSNNNIPSSFFIENNPYNQNSQNEDLVNAEVQSYRIIQNGESIPNIEQNVFGTQDAGIFSLNNNNLDNNISQYDLGNTLQNRNKYTNSNYGGDQNMNNQIYYSNNIYNKSSATFGNQHEISNP